MESMHYENQLSQLPLETDALRLALRRVLSPRRVMHTLGTESVAVTMAMRWEADTEKARLAALLHDITKECRNQLKCFEDYGILPSVWERSVPEVYHAITGAALAEHLGASEDVCGAIRWHSTGRADMTLLEKILYLADLTEPFRTGFAGLNELRRLCLVDLDDALALGLRLSIDYIQTKNRPMDSHSQAALDWVNRKGNQI